jgi:hypothetical protein
MLETSRHPFLTHPTRSESMPRVKNFARLALLPALALFLLADGCGDGSPNLDPEGGEKLKQARIAAYGKTGYVSDRGTATSATGGGAQGAARAKAQSGRR